jgi:hypothetical protein
MTDPIYVDDAEPVATVEAFIAANKIDDNFRPLARLLRRYARRLVTEPEPEEPEVPEEPEENGAE